MVNGGIIQNTYPKLDKRFFQKILKGHCNLRILAYKNLQAMGEAKKCSHREYAKILNEFLSKEINRLISVDKCVDIFRDFQATYDDFELLNKQMNSFTQFKFHLLRLQGVLSRLSLIIRSQFIRGPHYIVCILQRVKIERQIYILQLEQGLEVRIPLGLSQENLPYSYRYYDALIPSIQK